MSDIPSFPYALLWEERVVRSVANLTRQDARDFLALAGRVPDQDASSSNTRSPTPTARSAICAPAASRAPRC